MYPPLNKLPVNLQKSLNRNDVNPGYLMIACFSCCLVEHPVTELTENTQRYRRILINKLCFILANFCPLIGKIFFPVEWRDFFSQFKKKCHKTEPFVWCWLAKYFSLWNEGIFFAVQEEMSQSRAFYSLVLIAVYCGGDFEALASRLLLEHLLHLFRDSCRLVFPWILFI